MATLLIVDDEKNIREGLRRALKPQGYKILLAENGEDAYKIFMTHKVDLGVLDIRMPKLDGLQLLEKMNESQKPIPVVFMTGHGSVETAVEAMRLGAYDFMIKPINLDKLELIIQRALSGQAIQEENKALVAQVKEIEVGKFLLGRSRAIKAIIERVKLVARSNSNIYIYGESGTGKEVICDAIHAYSFPQKPLVKVNCAALPVNLIESELFGHEKGAFTGASDRKVGRFEAASGGTLFLDEVSEIPLDTQVKLLRVLQEKKIERVGSNESIDVDIRLISASNKNLEKEVKEGRFREDLFYRLNVIDILLPPLRERKGDVEYLARYFFHEFAELNNKEIEVTSNVYTAFGSYAWPGNVRELKNVIEKLVVLSRTGRIGFKDLPDQLKEFEIEGDFMKVPYGSSMADVEHRVIMETIKYCKGNKSEAAKTLGIGRKTLHRKLKEMKVDV